MANQQSGSSQGQGGSSQQGGRVDKDTRIRSITDDLRNMDDDKLTKVDNFIRELRAGTSQESSAVESPQGSGKR